MLHEAKPTLRLRQDGLVMQSLDERTVLLDLASSLYLEVNEAGSALLPLLEAGAQEEDLVDRLQTRWGLTADQARTDVTAFVDGLRQRGLLAGEPRP